MFKVIVIIGFILIIFNLGHALFNMIGSKSESKKVVRSLALRVLFSIILFVLILISNYFGLIESTGIPV
ncbi:MAG: hypothetical protein CBD16_00420 [Betaproteobacteria bacterium TMED156]|nr:MAG: hypothetical protein CBD16_00420 [Betaproteobacteria bacterium TMED156]